MCSVMVLICKKVFKYESMVQSVLCYSVNVEGRQGVECYDVNVQISFVVVLLCRVSSVLVLMCKVSCVIVLT